MNADITKEELSEWRDLRTTRLVLAHIAEFRNQTLVGVLSISRDKRDEQIDLVNGMDMVIEIMMNIHKEGVS